MGRRVALLDYGSGNLRSAQRALERVGASVEITSDARVALEADGLVVPGVGAFAACMEGLNGVRGPRIIDDRLAGSRPVLGICVGLQVMFDRGVEFTDGEHVLSRDTASATETVPDPGTAGGDAAASPDAEDTSDVEVEIVETRVEGVAGCGQWPGTVSRLEAEILPHMGWDTVEAAEGTRLFAGIDPGERFYFVHSYGVREWEMVTDEFLAPPLVSWCAYGGGFVAAVENGPLSATQFHPEKSGDAGAHLLENWMGTL